MRQVLTVRQALTPKGIFWEEIREQSCIVYIHVSFSSFLLLHLSLAVHFRMCACTGRLTHKTLLHSTAPSQKLSQGTCRVCQICGSNDGRLFHFLCQNKDLRSRVTHLEGSQRTNQDSLVSKLNSRIQELEERLQGEER